MPFSSASSHACMHACWPHGAAVIPQLECHKDGEGGAQPPHYPHITPHYPHKGGGGRKGRGRSLKVWPPSSGTLRGDSKETSETQRGVLEGQIAIQSLSAIAAIRFQTLHLGFYKPSRFFSPEFTFLFLQTYTIICFAKHKEAQPLLRVCVFLFFKLTLFSFLFFYGF